MCVQAHELARGGKQLHSMCRHTVCQTAISSHSGHTCSLVYRGCVAKSCCKVASVAFQHCTNMVSACVRLHTPCIFCASMVCRVCGIAVPRRNIDEKFGSLIPTVCILVAVLLWMHVSVLIVGFTNGWKLLTTISGFVSCAAYIPVFIIDAATPCGPPLARVQVRPMLQASKLAA